MAYFVENRVWYIGFSFASPKNRDCESYKRRQLYVDHFKNEQIYEKEYDSSSLSLGCVEGITFEKLYIKFLPFGCAVTTTICTIEENKAREFEKYTIKFSTNDKNLEKLRTTVDDEYTKLKEKKRLSANKNFEWGFFSKIFQENVKECDEKWETNYLYSSHLVTDSEELCQDIKKISSFEDSEPFSYTDAVDNIAYKACIKWSVALWHTPQTDIKKLNEFFDLDIFVTAPAVIQYASAHMFNKCLTSLLAREQKITKEENRIIRETHLAVNLQLQEIALFGNEFKHNLHPYIDINQKTIAWSNNEKIAQNSHKNLTDYVEKTAKEREEENFSLQNIMLAILGVMGIIGGMITFVQFLYPEKDKMTIPLEVNQFVMFFALLLGATVFLATWKKLCEMLKRVNKSIEETPHLVKYITVFVTIVMIVCICFKGVK